MAQSAVEPGEGDHEVASRYDHDSPEVSDLEIAFDPTTMLTRRER